jgi:predicted nucleic-acid-binding Zn-ribbon protein
MPETLICMKSGKCLKCGSSEVFVNSTINQAVIHGTMFTRVTMETYCCAECGYLENYVKESRGKAKIAENWLKISSLNGNS